MARGAASSLASWLVAVLVCSAAQSGARAEEDCFLRDVEERVQRLKHERRLDAFGSQCGFGSLVVVHGGSQPDIEGVRSHAPPLAKFETENVEFIHVSQASCLLATGSIPNDMLIYDDGALGNIDFLTSISSISGHLVIWGAGSGAGAQITNFNGFQNLQVIGGSLNIVNMEAVTNLGGFLSLSQIGGDLLIWNNGMLENFQGLGSITEVKKTLYIDNNHALTSLSGLENVESIGFDLLLKGNGQLADLSALSNVNAIWNSILIQNMQALTSLSFLQTLTTLGNGIDLYENPLLKDLSGLEGLEEIKGDLVLVGNGLESTRGVENVQTIGLDLIISQHSQLTDLSGLGSVQSAAGLVSISDNEVLENCEGLNSMTAIGHDLFVQRNAAMTSLQGLVVQQVGVLTGGNLVIHGNPQLASLGDLPTTLTEVKGGVRISANSPSLPTAEADVVAATALEGV